MEPWTEDPHLDQNQADCLAIGHTAFPNPTAHHPAREVRFDDSSLPSIIHGEIDK
jgi:hypothetical protein